MKLLKVFPEQPKSDVEFFINPNHISSAFIAYCRNIDKFQLWVKVGEDSYHVGTYDSKLAALDKLNSI